SAGGCNLEVWREPAVRIDFLGWQRQNRALDVRFGETLQGGEKEPDVLGYVLNLAIGGDDEKDRLSMRGGRYGERLCRGGEAGDFGASGCDSQAVWGHQPRPVEGDLQD